MANTIITFTPASVPSFLSDYKEDSDLTAHASLSYPVISIKGKVFTVVRDGVRKTLTNPKDPDSPANYLDAILVKANPNKSKAYYEGVFKEGEDIKPRCFSNDGHHPDASVANPCSKSCANCPFNAFGSRRNPDGTMGKGKACSDSVRIAVATVDNLEDPYMIRVPATSMKALGELGRVLAQHKVPYQGVVTRISFEPSVATPRLVFKPMGFVTEEVYRKAIEVSKSDLVKAIIGEIVLGSEERAAEAAEIADARHETNNEVSPKVVTPVEAENAIQNAGKPRSRNVVTPDEAEAAIQSVNKVETADDLLDSFKDVGFDA